MRAALAIAALALATPTCASLAQSAEPANPYRELQRRDQMLFAVGWRLVVGNEPFCDKRAHALGVLWQDLATYPDPAAAGNALGVIGPVIVQAVAPESPAAIARLAVGDTLDGIGVERRGDRLDDVAMSRVVDAFPATRPSWARLEALHSALERIMQRDGNVVLQWQDEDPRFIEKTTLEPVQACVARFEVSGIGERAVADGERVVFGDRFPGFEWPEEEFAAAVAHELAHNLLSHRTWLDRHGRSRSNIRRTEREADRLAPWLLANAGYDPAAAVRLMRRWGPEHGGGLFRKRTHAGWDERAEMMAAELPLVKRAIADVGRADWSRYFRRETGE